MSPWGVRRALEQHGQRLMLLVDGDAFRGAIDRAALDPQAPDSAPAATLARRDVVTVTPATPIADASELLDRSGEPRLGGARPGRRQALRAALLEPELRQLLRSLATAALAGSRRTACWPAMTNQWACSC